MVGRKSASTLGNMKIFCYAFLTLFLLPRNEFAQVGAKPDEASPSSEPLRERMLDENEFFRVSRLDAPIGKVALIGSHKRDLIVIALSEISLSAHSQSVTPVPLPEGAVRFVSGETPSAVSSSSAASAQVVVADLKQHWDAEIRECKEPKKCSHPIVMGPAEIGETTLLFTNGFVMAYRHRLQSGGTLSSSYYSSASRDHLLFIALSDVHASFDGEDEQLKAGQVYTSDATQVEVSAGQTEARWIVVRVNSPKHPN